METCKNEAFFCIINLFFCVWSKPFLSFTRSVFFHLLASVHRSSSLFSTPTVLFFHPPVGGRWVFGVMIAWHVVSQLWVIRSNIISKAINGRQYSCVFYSFFSFLPEHINKLTFYPYRLKLNYIQGKRHRQGWRRISNTGFFD